MQDQVFEFYEVKVKIKTIDDKGKVKKHNESYLVKAVSVTDAEATFIEKEFKHVPFDFEVVSAKQTKIVAVVNG